MTKQSHNRVNRLRNLPLATSRGEMEEIMKKISAKLESPPVRMIPILKSLTPAQRLTTVFNLSKMVRSTMSSYIRSSHSGWDDEQVEKEVARRILHGAG